MSAAYGAAEAEVAYKIAKCFRELQKWEAAVAELESIPLHLRGAAVYCSLGQLYRRGGNKKAAVHAYKVRLAHHMLPVSCSKQAY